MTKKLRDLLSLHTQGRDPDDYLFKGPKQGVLHYNWFHLRIWKPAVERLGIESFTFRGLRRTFASLMISKHAPVTVVSAVLGHSTVRTTLEAYAHFYEADKIEYLERLAISV